MYVNGMGFRAIERVTGVNHNTVINWVRLVSLALPNAPEPEEIPEITELDELETFVGIKKPKIWLWTAMNHWQPGILAQAYWFENCRHVPTAMANCSLLGEFFLRQ